MKKILFVYTKMIVGGSTTSLLSILNNMDYSTYQVDLLLLENGGDLFDQIPKEVRILEQADVYQTKPLLLNLRRLSSPRYLHAFIKSRILPKKLKNPLIRQQIMSYQAVRYTRVLEESYDLAVGFLEFWPSIYVSQKVKAKKKITWVHIDYQETGLLADYDRACFGAFAHIVLVSERCVTNFQKIFPEYAKKALLVENILTQKTIRTLASQEEVDLPLKKDQLHFVTTCRIVFSHKGLDRGVRAFKKVLDAGLKDFTWYIIGDGPDRPALEAMIQELGLEEHIRLLGQKINPFPYMKAMDVFFLPSHYEGKPMAVTEAMMLGLVPLVTDYASAKDQISQGENGIIVANEEAAIEEALYRVIADPKEVRKLHEQSLLRDYSNLDEMKKILGLFDR